jgi:pilus assembly protein Flp/PilA
MRTSFARFVNDESGATAIEYGLIAAGIAVAILTAVQALGTSLSGLFTSISGTVGGVTGGGGGGGGGGG